METGRRWLGYDTFKLVVFLILAALVVSFQFKPPFLMAWLPGTAPTPAVPPTNPSATPQQAAQPPTPTQTASVQASPTPEALPSATSEPTATQEPLATPTATATPTLLATSDLANCPLALKSYLKVGRNAHVTTTLNMRSLPELSSDLVKTLTGDTQVLVIDGPVCVPFLEGAYVWWKVQLANGLTGWVVEGSLKGNTYFLRLVP